MECDTFLSCNQNIKHYQDPHYNNESWIELIYSKVKI